MGRRTSSYVAAVSAIVYLCVVAKSLDRANAAFLRWTSFPIPSSTTRQQWLGDRISPMSVAIGATSKNSSGGRKLAARKKTHSPAASSNKSKKSSRSDAKQMSGSAVVDEASLQRTGPQRSPGMKKSTPPWQVLSSKDAMKNVEQEKSRRNSLRDGAVPVEVSHDDASLTSTTTGAVVLSKAFLNDHETKFMNWKRFNPEKTVHGHTFVGAYLDRKLPPRLGVPEVAFLGRSNVGKSSLLNRLSSRTGGDLARVGKTPGATASVNLYTLIDRQNRNLLGLTDLPGFGYAKLSKEVQQAVIEAAEHYLNQRQELALGILLVDIRREPSDDDRAVLAALFDMGVPIVVVATKMDKVDSKTERERLLLLIQEQLGLPEGQPLTVSSVTGEGCRDLWRIIMEACETCVAEFKQKYTESDPNNDDDDGIIDPNNNNNDPWYDFDDSEDIVYDQGYDWVHGSAASVSDLSYNNDETMDESDAHYYDDDERHATTRDEKSQQQQQLPPERETLKSLKKKVKEMQKRGQI